MDYEFSDAKVTTFNFLKAYNPLEKDSYSHIPINQYIEFKRENVEDHGQMMHVFRCDIKMQFIGNLNEKEKKRIGVLPE